MTAGELLTRWTVRAALAFYVLTVAVRLSPAWRRPRGRRLARLAWTAGCLLFLTHVAAAFHVFHGWSHAHAYRETARQTRDLTGFDAGAGLYLNYAFTLAWAADAAWWWAAGAERYARRPRWVDVSLHAFLGFMAFNGTVVFETGATRWVALAACAGLAAVAFLSARTHKRRAAGHGPSPAGQTGVSR